LGGALDLLSNFYTSATWGSEIAARFNTIMIKGFSVTRTILSIANDDFAEPTATSVAYRWDIKGNYGGIVGATYTDIVTC